MGTSTVVFPASNGGANWGGASVDPALGYYFINTRSEGAIGHMAPPALTTERRQECAQGQRDRVRPHGPRGGRTGLSRIP